MRRRRLLCLAASGLATLSFPVLAQTARQVRRIGFPGLGSAQSVAVYFAAFRQGMLELRRIEGRDHVIDARYANGVAQAGPALAAELVTARPDLLLVPAKEHARARTRD